MNLNPKWDATAHRLAHVSELLVDVAVKIQLSPSLHDKAVEHYKAIHTYLDREGSPFQGRVRLFYPQGSMAIGATIRSRDEDDLFDIDLVAEIRWNNETPGELLDLLFDALNGAPGSRYHGKVRRQTRCVTVDYDDMHLDVTPLVRKAGWPERGGYIAHAHEDDPPTKHKWVAANPWGFAEWFKTMTPRDDWFRDLVLAKSLAFDSLLVEKAEAKPVPDHEHVFAKSLAVVALQLTKRWARHSYERQGAKGRCIPSIALSYSFACQSGATNNLLEELIHQATAFRALLVSATAKREVVDLRNPKLNDDCLTDRWPGDVNVQWAFAEDLRGYISELEAARTATAPELKAILGRLFGEQTTQVVLDEFYKRSAADVSAGRSVVLAGSGAAVAGLAVKPAAGTVSSPAHRFYGD